MYAMAFISMEHEKYPGYDITTRKEGHRSVI
jgi:hypothetical protein